MRIKTYLRNATCGLWGHKRQEVCEELEVHIQERVMAYRISGLSEADAVEKALREMGEPGKVRAEMLKLYAVPWIVGSGMLVAAVCAVAVTALSNSLAQSLPVEYRWPTEGCLEASAQMLPAGCKTNTPWTSVAALERGLEPLGVKVKERADAVTLAFPGAQPVHLTPFNFKASTLKNNALNLQARDGQWSEGYYPLHEVINQIVSQVNVPVRLEGWENPVLHIGATTLQLGADDQVVRWDGFYVAYLYDALTRDPSFPKLFASVETVYAGWDSALDYSVETKHLKVGAEAGEVYGLFVWLSSISGVTLWFDVAPVDIEGTVELRFPNESVTFMNSLDELDEVVPVRDPEAGRALVVRFKNTLTTDYTNSAYGGEPFVSLAYDIVPPAQLIQQ